MLLEVRKVVSSVAAVSAWGLVAAPIGAVAWSMGHIPGVEPRMFELLVESAGVAALVALVSVVVGASLAWLVFRGPPVRRLFWAGVLVLPLFVPGYIHALTWSGLIPSLDSILAVIWVSAVSLYPWAFILLGASLVLWGNSRARESAALQLTPTGALSVEMRFHAPVIMVAGLMVFVLSFAQFAVADHFGVRVYATEVFARVAGYLDVASAVSLSLPVLAIGTLVVLTVAVLGRRVAAGLEGLLVDAPGPGQRRGYWKEVVTAGAATALVAVPMVHMAYRSGGIGEIFMAASISAWDTVTGAAVSGLCSVVAVGMAWLATYQHGPTGQGTRMVTRVGVVAAFLLPSAVIGLGHILLWNQPGWREQFYLGGGALVLALLGRWLWLATEGCSMLWGRFPTVQEEAGHVSGMGWGRTLWHVCVPQQRWMLAGIGLLVFVFTFNDLGLMVLLGPPGMSTLPLRIFSTAHYGPETMVAALCLWQIVVLAVPVGLILWLMSRLGKGYVGSLFAYQKN